MPLFAKLREQAGLSLSETEKLLKLSVETVTDYESGARVPSPREIQILKGFALGLSCLFDVWYILSAIALDFIRRIFRGNQI
jgi:transcriptional regulator with XRE-family HTH domain